MEAKANMGMYVCFNDSEGDPTYAGVDNAWLVESNLEAGEGNPCSKHHAERAVPIIPVTSLEVRMFAEMLGWSVDTDNDGQLIIYTGVQK